MSNQNQPGQQNQTRSESPASNSRAAVQKPGQQQQDPSRRQGEKPMQNPIRPLVRTQARAGQGPAGRRGFYASVLLVAGSAGRLR